ncbi:MAG: hypothetical protein OEU54_03070 [Gemmatimonadota bacterium]|nr:hypothetical protein [Gemmatimonadota bacterium]
MMDRTLKRFAYAAMVAAVLLPIAACSSDAPMGPTFQNPSTIRVANNLLGPVLFFRVRACGTTDWGQDLLPTDPIEGTIQPGESKDFTVEAGCYDLQAQHLETTDPGPLITKETFDQNASTVAILNWTLEETPGGPS